LPAGIRFEYSLDQRSNITYTFTPPRGEARRFISQFNLFPAQGELVQWIMNECATLLRENLYHGIVIPQALRAQWNHGTWLSPQPAFVSHADLFSLTTCFTKEIAERVPGLWPLRFHERVDNWDDRDNYQVIICPVMKIAFGERGGASLTFDVRADKSLHNRGEEALMTQHQLFQWTLDQYAALCLHNLYHGVTIPRPLQRYIGKDPVF